MLDFKFYAIEEMQDLKSLTLHQLHGILTEFEMRKYCPSDMREVSFKDRYKGEKKEAPKNKSYLSDKEVSNIMRKLQVGIGKFRGKLPFKCFSCGRVGHYIIHPNVLIERIINKMERMLLKRISLTMKSFTLMKIVIAHLMTKKIHIQILTVTIKYLCLLKINN